MLLPIENVFIKFILMFSSFYLSNGIMAIIYINKLRNKSWHQSHIEGLE